MRCSCCDFSPTAPSDFYTGLSVGFSGFKKLNNREGVLICTECEDSVWDSLKEFADPEDDLSELIREQA